MLYKSDVEGRPTYLDSPALTHATSLGGLACIHHIGNFSKTIRKLNVDLKQKKKDKKTITTQKLNPASPTMVRKKYQKQRLYTTLGCSTFEKIYNRALRLLRTRVP